MQKPALKHLHQFNDYPKEEQVKRKGQETCYSASYTLMLEHFFQANSIPPG